MQNVCRSLFPFITLGAFLCAACSSPAPGGSSPDGKPASTVDAPPIEPPPATSFDCVHGWLFEVDAGGAHTPTAYSSSGICMKWERYLGADQKPEVPCDQLPSGATADSDAAFQQGCRPRSAHPGQLQSGRGRRVRVAFPLVTLGALDDYARIAARFAALPQPMPHSAAKNVARRDGNQSPPARVDACDAVTHQGCTATEKCAWVIDRYDQTGRVGHLACVAQGAQQQGQACVIGTGGAMPTGADNCARGLACDGAVCSQVCNHREAQACGTQKHCILTSGLFFNQGEEARAGVCRAACDPVTQKRADGAAACGSANLNAPELGCYGNWGARGLSQFTCAPAGPADRRSDYKFPADARVFMNSCAPGFASMLFAGNGSMQSICSAYCNPGDVYQGHAAEKGGVRLAQDPAAKVTCGDRGAL